MIDFIEKNPSEVAFSVNHPYLMSEKIISKFKYGIINAHAGDLPRYRGNACQAWAIINNESKIALSIHLMDAEKLDSGDILIKEYLTITDNTRIAGVYKWIYDRTPFLYFKTYEGLINNSIKPVAQKSLGIKPLRCFPRNESDGRIDLSKNAESIVKLVNASSEPYSGAFCYYKNEKFTIWRAKTIHDIEFDYNSSCGQVYLEGENVYLMAFDKPIQLLEVEYKDYRGKPKSVLKSIRTRLT